MTMLALPATAGAQSGGYSDPGSGSYANPQLSARELRARIRQYTRYATIVERLERCNYFRLQRLLRGTQRRSCRALSRRYRLRYIPRRPGRVERGFVGGREAVQGEFVQLVCLMRRGCVRYPQGINEVPPRSVPAPNPPENPQD